MGQNVLMLGLGNTLLSDGGIGIHVIRYLQKIFPNVIKDGKIANYQAVVPSTWNAGPRDSTGQDGAYEAALTGHKLHDPKQPIEILRTIHSLDPCIACAVHVTRPGRRGTDQGEVEVRWTRTRGKDKCKSP